MVEWSRSWLYQWIQPAVASSPRPLDPSSAPRPPTGTSTAGVPLDGWSSDLLSVSRDGRLAYRDHDGQRLPDFGAAGYGGGRSPLPEAAVVHTVGPVPGDNTRHLQRAIDRVAAMPANGSGIRGALLLRPGTYDMVGTLTVSTSGVVVRGSGAGDDPSTETILRAVGDSPRGRDVVVIGTKGSWKGVVPGTRTDLTADLVPIGSTSVAVADGGVLRPGSPVVITHPCTLEWLRAIDGPPR